MFLEMIELQRKLTQEMYDLQFGKVREGEMSGNVCNIVDTSYKVVVEDQIRGEGDRMEISTGRDDKVEISCAMDNRIETSSRMNKVEKSSDIDKVEISCEEMDVEVMTVPDNVDVKEGQVVYDSKMEESSDGDIAGAWKGRFVSRLHLSHGVIHLLTWKKLIWVISAEISNLKPMWRGHDCLNTFLKYKPVNFQMETLVAAEEEETWQELVMAEVGGLLDRKGKLVSTLSLYRFGDFMEILKMLHVDLDMLDVKTMELWKQIKDLEI